MGYDLMSKNKTFYARIVVFPDLLHLAYLFGWNPRGTEFPDMQDESVNDTGKSACYGTYFSNDFQTVIKEDAEEIAVSLKKALKFMQDNDFALREAILKVQDITLADFDVRMIRPSMKELVKGGIIAKRIAPEQMPQEEIYRLFSNFIDGTNYLKEFIDFCEDGEFCIS